MPEAFICDAVRTPIGRYAGGLAKVRTDDLGAVPIKALMKRHPKVDWTALDEVYFGCANQAGEDNRNVARMALLLAGLPDFVPGITVNRLCSSGLNAVGLAAQGIRAGEIDFAIAGGVESMTRAPLVMGKAQEAFQRSADGRGHHHRLALHQSADEAAVRRRRHAGDGGERRRGLSGRRARTRTRSRCARSSARRRRRRRAIFAEEIEPVIVPGGKAGPVTVEQGRASAARHDARRARPSSSRSCASPAPITAGNASGVNDGAAAMIIASEAAVKKHGLTPIARITGMASAGVPPRVMGIGPVPSTQKLMARYGLKIGDFDVIELNEAFASQALACLRQLGLADDAEHVNPNGGAIALGHPLGMSGARLAMTAAHQMVKQGGKRALATMCVGVGQGVSLAIERV